MNNHGLNSGILFALLLLLTFSTPAQAGEAYTWQGIMGFSTSFALIGGHYQIYVNAHMGPDFMRRSSCIFGGVFQQVSPKNESSELGPRVPINVAAPYHLGPKPVNLDEGLYHVLIAAATNCQWRFTLVSDNTNPAGLSPVLTYLATDRGLTPANTITMKDKIHFQAQYRTDHDAKVPVSGEMQVYHEGKLINSFPLHVDVDPNTTATRCYVTLYWRPQLDQAYLGKDTAKFVVKIGNQQFTSSADFTLSP